MSTSMSGGPSRSGDRNRSNKRPRPTASALVIPERVANGGIGRRPPALAINAGLVAKTDDVPDDEEIAGETELVDHVEFVIDLGIGAGVAGRPAGARSGAGHLLRSRCRQPGHLGVAGRGGERGEIGRHQLQVERTGPAQPAGRWHGTGVAGETAGLLGPAAQVGAGRGRQPAVHVVQAAPAAHGGHGRGQAAPPGTVVVDVVGGHHVGAQLAGDLGQGVVAGTEPRGSPWSQISTATLARPKWRCRRASSARAAAGPELTRAFGSAPLRHPVSTSPVARCRTGEAAGPSPAARGPAAGAVRHGNSGKVQVGTGPDGGQEGQVHQRAPLFPAQQMGDGKRLAQAGVAGRAPGQNHQMRTFRVGHRRPVPG